MTNEELNQYIKHYIEKDKTGRAIMLSGAWGIGKSYYIKNILIPFLEKKENGKHSCVIISLYGLSELSELSKAIFLEARIKKLNPKSEAGKAALLAGKTVIKGVSSFFGVDIGINERGLQSIYESIDLSKKLLILEDVERTQINILELLGYVNSLVEQDGVKVLLVTNEEEIIQYESTLIKSHQSNGTFKESLGEKIVKTYTEETKQYLKMKEKTVSDTISFWGDLQTAVKAIINSFDNVVLQRFNNDESAEDIVDIMLLMQSSNLRSIIFGCQKTVDIYELIPNIDCYSHDFLCTIFYGILFFSFRLHAGNRMGWEGLTHYSLELGGSTYPLFRFCFDYILTQQFALDEIPLAVQSLEKMRLYDRNKTNNDVDLQRLYCFYLGTEADIFKTVERITNRLEDPSDIAFSEYGKIAAHLIIVKYYFGVSIDTAKTLLISNLYGRNGNITENDVFWYSLGEITEETTAEYNQLRNDMLNSLFATESSFSDFDYSPGSINNLCEYIKEKSDSIYKNHGLLKHLDISLFTEMLVNSNAAQMDNLRAVFHDLYKPGNIADFLPDDKEPIDVLIKNLQENEKRFSNDKVKKLQFKWFVDKLFEIKKKYN